MALPYATNGQVAQAKVELTKVIEKKVDLPEGGTPGQVLTKTATGTTWADGGGGGGLPEATAGQAMVHNGTSWAKQDGYGYTTPASTTSVTWNGVTRDYTDTITMGTYTFKKISANTPSLAQLSNCTTISATIPPEETETFNCNGQTIDVAIETEFTSGDPSKLIVVSGDDCLQCLVALTAQTLITEDSISIVVPSVGIYMYYDGDDTEAWYCQTLTYGTPAVIHTLDKKYLPEGVPYLIEDLTTINFDNTTTGKITVKILNDSMTVCKVSDETPESSEIIGRKVTFGDLDDSTYEKEVILTNQYYASGTNGYVIGVTDADEGLHYIVVVKIPGDLVVTSGTQSATVGTFAQPGIYFSVKEVE